MCDLHIVILYTTLTAIFKANTMMFSGKYNKILHGKAVRKSKTFQLKFKIFLKVVEI